MKPEDIAELTKNSELDQAVAGLATIARASRSYYEELISSGFSKSEAFELVKHWQITLFSAKKQEPERAHPS